MFAEYGDILNVQLNLDRQSGLVKNCFIVYGNEDEAAAAIKAMDEVPIKNKHLKVSWAFQEPPPSIKR